jgi:hypothetical protein
MFLAIVLEMTVIILTITNESASARKTIASIPPSRYSKGIESKEGNGG